MYNHQLRTLRDRELGILKSSASCRNKYVSRYLSNTYAPNQIVKCHEQNKYFEKYPFLQSKLELDINKIKYSVGFSPSDIRQMVQTCNQLEHSGCVNTACWLDDMAHLVTGSDDKKVKVWKLGHDIQLVHTLQTGHRSNIFCVEQSPLDRNTFYTCAADGELRRCNVNSNIPHEAFADVNGRGGMMHMFKFSPHNPHELVTAQGDGHSIMYDTRLPSHSTIFDIEFHRSNLNRGLLRSVRCVEFHPIDQNLFVVGGEAGTNIQVYDKRKVLGGSKYPVYEISLAPFYNGEAYRSDKTFSIISGYSDLCRQETELSNFSIDEISDVSSVFSLSFLAIV